MPDHTNRLEELKGSLPYLSTRNCLIFPATAECIPSAFNPPHEIKKAARSAVLLIKAAFLHLGMQKQAAM